MPDNCRYVARVARMEEIMKRMLVALTLVGGFLIPAGHAFAAPGNAQYGQTFPIYCTTSTGSFMGTAVVNSGQAGQHGQGNATTFDPGFITGPDGSGKVIPTSETFTYTATGVSETDTYPKGNAQGPAAGTPVTCTFTLTFPDGTVNGTVTGYLLSQ